VRIMQWSRSHLGSAQHGVGWVRWDGVCARGPAEWGSEQTFELPGGSQVAGCAAHPRSLLHPPPPHAPSPRHPA